MAERPVLEVSDLRTCFRTGSGIATAVDGITFSIHRSETYALVGESGCGKSVTALSILQLVSGPAGYIEGGSIHLAGREISELPPDEMRKIRGNRVSMIFQEPMTALNPVFSVGNQISEAILLHQDVSRAEARTRGIEMLAAVGIPDPGTRYSEYPHQLSGGMRQRVMIAMALSCRPDLLIADEPTTALDVTIQAQILALMSDLQDDLGTAILLITHDMGVVRENADRVGVMYAGAIVEEAPLEELFSSPSHPYTQLLLDSLPSRASRTHELVTIEGMVPKATALPLGCRFNNRCPVVMDRCRTKAPSQYPAGRDHTAACFIFDSGVAVRSSGTGGSGRPAPPAMAQSDISRLAIRDLTVHFPIRKGLLKRTVGHVRAVDGVDLEVCRGETVALVGESGCGKTTVGKCTVRLHQPTSGSIRIDGEETAGLSRSRLKEYRRRVQMVFQDPFSCLNPRRMIGETVAEGMEVHGIGTGRKERRERADSIMGRVGLDPEMLRRYPHEFSGGQRQRVGLARALAVDPELIICDEATSSLDVSVQAQILNLLRQLQSELGLSYLFITHDLSVVRYLADTVAVMYLGRIVERGRTEEVFGDTRHPYTRALLAAAPHVDRVTGQHRVVLKGDVPSPVNPPSGCHFHPRCPEAVPECSHVYPGRIAFSSTHTCHCLRAGPGT